MSVIVGSTGSAVARSLHGINSNGSASRNLNAVRDFYRFQQLYKFVIAKLNIYMGYFKDGDFMNLSKLMKTDDHNLILFNIKNNSLCFNSVITNLENIQFHFLCSSVYDITRMHAIFYYFF